MNYPSEKKTKKNYTRDNNEKITITAVHKNEAGIITDFKLSDGRILDKKDAVEVAKTEGIEGVNVGRTRGRYSHEILRANPTNDPSKALYNLPIF